MDNLNIECMRNVADNRFIFKIGLQAYQQNLDEGMSDERAFDLAMQDVQRMNGPELDDEKQAKKEQEVLLSELMNELDKVKEDVRHVELMFDRYNTVDSRFEIEFNDKISVIIGVRGVIASVYEEYNGETIFRLEWSSNKYEVKERC